MSSDIRIKSKKTENPLRNKSATKKKEEISILPWDIENLEEDFEL